jgi:hypothetical protein
MSRNNNLTLNAGLKNTSNDFGIITSIKDSILRV